MSLSNEQSPPQMEIEQLEQHFSQGASLSGNTRPSKTLRRTEDMSSSNNDNVSRALSFDGEPTSSGDNTTFNVDNNTPLVELERIQRQIEELISSKQLSEQESNKLDKEWNLFKKFVRSGCSSEQLDALIREELSDYEGNHNIVNYESDNVIASMPFSATTKNAAAAIATHATEEGEHFCGIDSRTCDERYHRIAIINDFPVTGNEKYGPLTGRTTGGCLRSGDFLPRNATAWAEFFSLIVTLHLQYGMAIDKALYVVTHSCLWLDILSITKDKESSGSKRYKTLRDLCDEHSVKFIWGVLKESSVTHVVVNGVPAFQFIQDHPEAIPDDVKMLQKCKIVHGSKIVKGVRDREMYEKLNTLSVMFADILGEEPKSPISIARISNAFLMLGKQGLFDAQGNSINGGNGDYFYKCYLEGAVVMVAHDRTDLEDLLLKMLGFTAELPSQDDIINNVNNGFKGLTFELADYTEFNHATDTFGVIDDVELAKWVSVHYRDLEQELAEYEKKQKEAKGKLLAPSP